MKTTFKKSFANDLKKRSQNKRLLSQVAQVIQAVEAAQSLQDINNLKKLKANDNAFRIRVGDYRLGLIIENDTVCFVRLLSRKEIYRYFP
ncbi:type II toxin-antitoxin system RelE/ParE family toxin [Desulfatiferula olefinivorans]